MQPDVGNPVNLPSFPRPIPLPLVDPDSAPTISVAVSCAWLPYIRGALSQLVQQYTWPQDVPSEVLLAQQRAMTLIAMFEECGGGLPVACPYDFTTGDQHGWNPWMGFAHWYGAGFEQVSNSLYIVKHFASPITLTALHIEAFWDGTCGGPAAGFFVWSSDPPTFATRFVDRPLMSGLAAYDWFGSIGGVTDLLVGMNADSGVCSTADFRVNFLSLEYVSPSGCQ